MFAFPGDQDVHAAVAFAAQQPGFWGPAVRWLRPAVSHAALRSISFLFPTLPKIASRPIDRLCSTKKYVFEKLGKNFLKQLCGDVNKLFPRLPFDAVIHRRIQKIRVRETLFIKADGERCVFR